MEGPGSLGSGALPHMKAGQLELETSHCGVGQGAGTGLKGMKLLWDRAVRDRDGQGDGVTPVLGMLGMEGPGDWSLHISV